MWKYYALRLAYLMLGRLPLRVLYGIAHVAGDGAYWTRSGMRRDVSANMRQVMGPGASEGEVRRAAREVFRNAGRYYADLIHMPRLDMEYFYREQLERYGRLMSAMDSRPIHLGLYFPALGGWREWPFPSPNGAQ